MAFEIPGFSYAREASTDLSASQFCAVVIDSNGRAALPSANGTIVGVLQNKPASLGAEAAIMSDGVTKMVCSAAIAVGAQVKVDAAGKATPTPATGNYVIGIALTATAAANELLSVLLQSPSKF